MPGHFKLGDLFKIGSSKRVLKSQWQSSGVPFYRGREITKLSKDGFVENDLFISEELYSEYAKKYGVPTVGDIVITAIGTIGNSHVVRQDDRFYFKDASVLWLKRNSEVSCEYINWWLKSPVMREQLDEGNGATVDTLTIKKLQTLTVDVPAIPEQKRIVTILDQAFADIEKARANAEQNLKNARELFESYLQQVFSERGEGWVDTDIGSLVEEGILAKPLDGNHGDVHPKRSDYEESGIPFVMASDINNGIVNTHSCKFISRKLADSLRKGFAKHGDVLLSHKATIGRSAILETDLDYAMLTPQVTYYRVLDEEALFNEYVYWYFNTPSFLSDMNEYAGVGSTRAYIGITKQLKLKFSYPNIEKQKYIVKKLKVLSLKISTLAPIYEKKLASLDELKKSILQKAFSGELTASSDKTRKEQAA